MKKLLPIVIFFSLILGIWFRFYHLNSKVYWHDEVFTSLRASGYIGDRVSETLKQQGVFKAGELQQYQQLSPELGWGDTLASLQTHPEHPPLFYLGTRLWMELFGSSVAVTRSFAAVISLLAFPCLYWLCLELFQSRLVGGIAIALFAVSPFQVLYAQEARQYSLWTVTVILSSAVLLWARRKTTPKTTGKQWLAYAATVAFGFYTSLFFAFTLISHGLYLITVEGWRHRNFRFYLTAVGIGILCFLPWISVILQYRLEFQQKTAWSKVPTPLDFLIKLWGLHISSGFIDPGFPLEHLYTYLIPPALILLILGAGWQMIRKTSKQVWLFILFLIAVNVLLLIVPDLIFGGARSFASRYFVPTYIGTQLIMAYWISSYLTHTKVTMQQLGRFALTLLLICGIVSCTLSAQAHTWWSKGISYGNPVVAKIMNQAKNPFVIMSTLGDTLGNSISLSYFLKPETRMQFVADPTVPQLPADNCDIFLFYPSEVLQQNLSQTHAATIEPFELGYGLSRVKGTKNC